MAETETITAVSPPSLSESDYSTALPTMDVNQKKESVEEAKKKKPEVGISLRIWPPPQKTREAVVNRLIETLCTDSILSETYGTLQPDEALPVAKSIEDEAYSVVSSAVFGDDDDGVEILKSYSKEISKRMLNSVKTRAVASPTLTVANGTESAAAATAVADARADSTEEFKDDDAPADWVKLEA